MGVDYSYECTEATVREDLGLVHGHRLVLCDLQFVDEHDHKLAPVENALVRVGDTVANLEQYAENILEEGNTAEEFAKYEKLCKNHPGFDVYNPEGLAAILRPQLV